MKRQPYNRTNPDALRAIGGDPALIIAQRNLRKINRFTPAPAVNIIPPVAEVIQLEEYRVERQKAEDVAHVLGVTAVDMRHPSVQGLIEEYEGHPANVLQESPYDV